MGEKGTVLKTRDLSTRRSPSNAERAQSYSLYTTRKLNSCVNLV